MKIISIIGTIVRTLPETDGIVLKIVKEDGTSLSMTVPNGQGGLFQAARQARFSQQPVRIGYVEQDGKLLPLTIGSLREAVIPTAA